jgi:hypothetical protein
VPKQKRKRDKPRDDFAALLMDAYCAVHLRANPHHDRPEWAGMTPRCRRPYELLAVELLSRGVRPPQAEGSKGP